MVYQLRLEAVKMFFHERGENCDDTRARTIELTEAEYLSARIEWCNKTVWAWFSKYWTSDEYKEKRHRAQESRMSAEDPAQNRGGSRNFADTTVLGMTNACVLIILVRNRWNLQLIILVQLIILQLAYFICDKCLCLDYFS